MGEVAPVTNSTKERITDALQLALRGEDYVPLPPDCIPFLVSGSVRHKSGFDPQVGCEVNIAEVHSLVRYNRGIQADYRLAVWWDNDTNDSVEYSLEPTGFVVDDESEYSDLELAIKEKKIMQALNAVMEDAI